MSRRYFSFLIALVTILIATTAMAAVDCTKLEKPGTDTSGILRFDLSSLSCDCSKAYKFLGEVGPENYRANLTFASESSYLFRYKIGGEYLSQRHSYHFSNSHKKSWIHQAAFGGAVQVTCPLGCLQSFDLAADYSHAWGKDLEDVTCSETEYERKISGSDAYNFRIGSTVFMPCNGLFFGWIGYDHVKYHRELLGGKTVKGIGGGVMVEQPIGRGFDVIVAADFKRPYHFYEAQVNWDGCSWGRNWEVGAFTNYTSGREGLGNDFKYGAQLTYRFGQGFNCCEDTCCSPCNRLPLDRWAAIPAVYRPVTLAVADQSLCEVPTVIGSPPTEFSYDVFDNITPVDFSVYFTGSDLTYSATNLPPNLVLDPNTGIMSGSTTSDEGVFNVTITATNNCGTASFNLDISVFGK